MRHSLYLGQSADQRVDIARLGFSIEVGRVGIEGTLLCRLMDFCRVTHRVDAVGILFTVFADAMSNEIHDIKTGDVLRFEEVNRL